MDQPRGSIPQAGRTLGWSLPGPLTDSQGLGSPFRLAPERRGPLGLTGLSGRFVRQSVGCPDTVEFQVENQ